MTNRLIVDPGPEEHARLDAESRRRGVESVEVVLDLVRGLPDPEKHRNTLEALAALRELRAQPPPICDDEIDAALAASRAVLERRALAPRDGPFSLPAAGEAPTDLLDFDPS